MLKIEGKQICLRHWQKADLAEFEKWMQPGHRWQDLDGPYYPPSTPDEVAKSVASIERRIDEADFPDPPNVLVIASLEDDSLLGTVSRYWQSKETNWLSLGLVIYDPQHWRRGIGYEALGLWSDYILRAMPELVRLDLRTWSGNPGMLRLAEKLGYQQEACFRKARIVKGEYYDGIGYGVLREEWQVRYPNGFGKHLAS